MDPHSLAGRHREDVVPEVFAVFDVILVGVGPIKFDFLALVGDGVDALLVAALGDEVALVVVAAEELVRCEKTSFSKAVTSTADSAICFLRSVTFGEAAGSILESRMLFSSLASSACITDLSADLYLLNASFTWGSKSWFKKRTISSRFVFMMRLDAEVQVGLIQLEQFFEQVAELFEFVGTSSLPRLCG